MPNPYTLGAASLVAVALLGGAGWLGYDYGATTVQQRWDAQRAAALQETSDAFATLVSGIADTEQRYAAERDRKQRVVERVKTEVRYEIRELPSRDCGLLPDARRLLIRSHCAAFGDDADPECVPDSMRTGPHPSEIRD